MFGKEIWNCCCFRWFEQSVRWDWCWVITCLCVCQVEKLKKQSRQREGQLKVKFSPGERSKDSLRLLKDMRTLQTSLRSDQHRWDYWPSHTHFTHTHAPPGTNKFKLRLVIRTHWGELMTWNWGFTDIHYFCAKNEHGFTGPASEEQNTNSKTNALIHLFYWTSTIHPLLVLCSDTSYL